MTFLEHDFLVVIGSKLVLDFISKHRWFGVERGRPNDIWVANRDGAIRDSSDRPFAELLIFSPDSTCRVPNVEITKYKPLLAHKEPINKHPWENTQDFIDSLTLSRARTKKLWWRITLLHNVIYKKRGIDTS